VNKLGGNKMHSYAVVYQTKEDDRKTRTMVGKNWTDIVDQLKALGEDVMMVHMTMIEENDEITPLADLYSTMWCSNHLRSENMFLSL